MIATLLIEVFIKAFLLLILLYIVARDEADYEFRKVTMVTAAIILGITLIDATLTHLIGLLALLPMAVFIVFMVMQFCWVRFWNALLIAVPFLMLNVMITTAVSSFHQKANQAIARGLQGPVSENDMKEAIDFFKQSVGDNSLPFPFPPPKQEQKVQEESLEQILLKMLTSWITSNQFSFKPAGKEQPAPARVKIEIRKGEDAPRRNEAPPAMPEKASKELEPSGTDWPGAEKKIRVGGILIGRDGVRVAIVNNQMIKEGEQIQIEHKKNLYRWRATFIRDKGVSWEPVEAVSR